MKYLRYALLLVLSPAFLICVLFKLAQAIYKKDDKDLADFIMVKGILLGYWAENGW